MARELTAIEVAEGALLADVAVLAQLVAIYLPIFDMLARLIIAVVFALLVLRRGLLVGALAALVACFLIAALSGLTFIVALGLTCGAGLFLGLAMKSRLPHIPLILLGMTGGAATLTLTLLLFALLAGLPLSDFGRELARSFRAMVALAGWLAGWAGLAGWWQSRALPLAEPAARALQVYWWAFFPLALWLLLGPVVLLMYSTTNLAVRLLGYQVRPFPGPRAERAIAWVARLPLRLRRRRGRGG